jgi:hypothetical protein
MASIFSFEMNRGAVLGTSELPVKVGNYVVQEDGSKREDDWRRWEHLKRGIDWQRLMLAAALGGLAVVIYIAMRRIGWVVDGFVRKPLS